MEPISPASEKLALKYLDLMSTIIVLNLVHCVPSESTSLFMGGRPVPRKETGCVQLPFYGQVILKSLLYTSCLQLRHS